MRKTARHALVLATAVLGIAGAAFAGPCEQNYSATGVPLVTPIVFKSWRDFKGLPAEKALDRMAKMVRREGFDGIKVNRGALTITAYQETTGTGRTQTLTVTVKETKKGTRATVSFKIRAGQVANDKDVRPGLCRIVNAADG